MLLSHKGYEVEVFEKQPYVGGRTSEIRLQDFYKDEELQFAFTFQAKYLGMSPWETPAFSICRILNMRTAYIM